MAKKKKQLTKNPSLFSKLWSFIVLHRFLLAFLLLMAAGLYFRFYRVEYTTGLGFDQTRDAWRARSILSGTFPTAGPKTGVGDFNLGPLWFYLLAPFYAFTHLDPIAAFYLSFVANVFNFCALFYVVRRIFSDNYALFVTFIYASSRYLIEVTAMPWNVTPVPGVAALIFYAIWKICQGHYRWFLALGFLTGLFTHLHFSVVFFPLIYFLSFIKVPDKKKALLWGCASIPFILIWLIPSIYDGIKSHKDVHGTLQNFMKYYFTGFHLRFLLYRLNDAFVQFRTVLFLPPTVPLLKFVMPVVYAVVLFFEKDGKKKFLGYLMLLWFIVPAIMYTSYGGPTSEYYVLFNAVFVAIIASYLQEKLLKLSYVPVLILLIILWSWYAYTNIEPHMIKKSSSNSLVTQRAEARALIQKGESKPPTEGDPVSYLYRIYTVDKVRQIQ